jgi:hypothetical protein
LSAIYFLTNLVLALDHSPTAPAQRAQRSITLDLGLEHWTEVAIVALAVDAVGHVTDQLE